MRKSIMFATLCVFIFAVGMARAQKLATSRSQPIPASPSARPNASSGGFSAVTQMRATPSSVPFTANNPGSTIAAGTVATITWNIAQGKNGQTWNLMVGTGSSSFIGCTTVPQSAVSLKCVSASVDGSGQASAGCSLSSFTTLPNTLPGLTLASGNEGNSSSHDYTVVLSYQLTDSWRYIANTCPLNVSYTVIAQ
jgi:hypothetical protein